ncbi:MAG TPA: DUF4389 domain-containing protein [Gaiellaceae bacterium]|nr:DUF4389 domain-containing protein [Gaiellaceae bacterium]
MDEGRVRVRDREPLRRRRLAVLLRAVLFVPHYVVIAVWSVLALPAAVVAWLALLVEGRLPTWLHRFLAAYLRYVGQATAWFHLLSGRYPDPLHTLEHPFAIDVPERPRQPRLITLARIALALPALILASVFRVVLSVAAIGAWFTGLALGRTTAGLQELGTFCLRYELETEAYVLLLTARYPRIAPPALSPAPE